MRTLKRNLAGAGILAICLSFFIGPQPHAEVISPPGGEEPPQISTQAEEEPDVQAGDSPSESPEENGPDSSAIDRNDHVSEPSLSEHADAQPETEGWFSDGADESGNPPAQSEDSVVRSRISHFDADEALNSIVDASVLLGSLEAERVAIPANTEIAVKTFGGESVQVRIEELGVSVGSDETLPTVEVLGAVASGVSPGGTVSFAFITDVDGTYSIVGDLEDTDSGDIRITPNGQGQYQIDEIASSTEVPAYSAEISDMVVEPPEEDVELFDESLPCPDGVCTNAQSSQATTVTLLAGAARGTGSLASIRTEMAKVVAKTNSAFRASRINARLSLMEVMTVNYNQNTQDAMLTDYGRLSRGEGGLRALKTRRDSIGADLVALIVPNAAPAAEPLSQRACGRGALGHTRGTPNSAFTVTALSCFKNESFQHEIGHNLGSAHNPEDSSADARAFVPSYAYGHRVLNVARDIMSYACAGNNCPRKNQFANPSVKFIGVAGRPSGTASRNAARVVDEVAQVAARYRTTIVGHDVPQNHKFYREITWLMNRRITTGYADGRFRPTAVVSREAMSAFLYRLAGKPKFSPPTRSPFKDVAKGSQFYKEITWMRAKGITTGRADGTFGPKDPVSRDATAAFLYRFAGKPSFNPPSKSPFSDVPKSRQFYKEITWLHSMGITTGRANGTFGPSDSVTREAMAAFLYRYDARI